MAFATRSGMTTQAADYSKKLCHHKTCRQSFWCNCHGKRGRAEWFAALCLGAPRLPRSPRAEWFAAIPRTEICSINEFQMVVCWFALDLPALPQSVVSLLPPPNFCAAWKVGLLLLGHQKRSYLDFMADIKQSLTLTLQRLFSRLGEIKWSLFVKPVPRC